MTIFEVIKQLKNHTMKIKNYSKLFFFFVSMTCLTYLTFKLNNFSSTESRDFTEENIAGETKFKPTSYFTIFKFVNGNLPYSKK
jgi:hypothetical protein